MVQDVRWTADEVVQIEDAARVRKRYRDQSESESTRAMCSCGTRARERKKTYTDSTAHAPAHPPAITHPRLGSTFPSHPPIHSSPSPSTSPPPTPPPTSSGSAVTFLPPDHAPPNISIQLVWCPCPWAGGGLKVGLPASSLQSMIVDTVVGPPWCSRKDGWVRPRRRGGRRSESVR